MSHKLIIKEENGICSLILDNPECHNAFDDRLIELLNNSLLEIENDTSIRVIVLSANGKNFSAGADLNWMKRMAQYQEQENLDDSIALARMMYNLYNLSKPTIAAVQGGTYGGGVGLLACCDFVIASPSAKFALSEVKLGLIPAVISPYVIKAIGVRQAKRYFLSAETFDALQAQRLGLVHEISEHALEDAKRHAMQWQKNGPLAMVAAKSLCSEVDQKPIDEQLLLQTAKKIAKIRVGAEGREGLSAFLEKRRPKWQQNEE